VQLTLRKVGEIPQTFVVVTCNQSQLGRAQQGQDKIPNQRETSSVATISATAKQIMEDVVVHSALKSDTVKIKEELLIH
jgi:hypothetical protein